MRKTIFIVLGTIVGLIFLGAIGSLFIPALSTKPQPVAATAPSPEQAPPATAARGSWEFLQRPDSKYGVAGSSLSSRSTASDGTLRVLFLICAQLPKERSTEGKARTDLFLTIRSDRSIASVLGTAVVQFDSGSLQMPRVTKEENGIRLASLSSVPADDENPTMFRELLTSQRFLVQEQSNVNDMKQAVVFTLEGLATSLKQMPAPCQALLQ